MYLEIWHIVILCLLFGFCATHNRKVGIKQGIQTAILQLCHENIIRLKADGTLGPGVEKTK